MKRGGDKCVFVSEDFFVKRFKFSLEESDVRKGGILVVFLRDFLIFSFVLLGVY